MKIHEIIKRERKNKGLTQEELARYLGVSTPAVNKWEKGLSFPDITLLPVIASFFKLSVDDLLGYEPQMVKEDIKKLYHKMADRFLKEPYDIVKADCDEYVRKYYSCNPLLLQMAVLYLNHYQLAPDPQKAMEEIMNLLDRVSEEREDIHLAKDAITMKAGCLLMLNQPAEVLEKLGEEIHPVEQTTEMQAQAYQLKGDFEKADRALQISMYQHVLMSVGDASMHIAWQQHTSDKTEEVIRRTLAVADIFQMDNLHFNAILQFYLACTQYYCMAQKEADALEMLERYVNCAFSQKMPLKLHGDNYFDKVDDWLAELALGKEPPRGDAAICLSMYQAVAANPAFEYLKENAHFQHLLKRLEEFGRVQK